MADVTLSDGREIDFDLTRITVREYRALFDPKQPQADEDAAIVKVCGLTPDEYLELSLLDQKVLFKAFIRKAREPLADPN
jgi:hypothetical protein